MASLVKIASGSTTPGSTNWKSYGTRGIYVDVSTSFARITGTPVYVTSLGGNSHHWQAIGATSIYQPTATGFRVYVRWLDGGSLTPAQANELKWHINWIAMEQDPRVFFRVGEVDLPDPQIG